MAATTTEQTDKHWKMVTIYGVIAILSGFLGLIIEQTMVFIGLSGIGVVVLIYAKVMAWWEHG